MNKIIWISRHDMTNSQLDDLKNIFGEELSIYKYDKTISENDDIKKVIAGFDIVAVVLPLEIINEIHKIKSNDVRVIQSISERVMSDEFVVNAATGKSEREYIFVHKYWKEIVDIDLNTKILSKEKISG